MEFNLGSGFVVMPIDEYEDMNSYTRSIGKELTEVNAKLNELKKVAKEVLVDSKKLGEYSSFYPVCLYKILDAVGMDANELIEEVEADANIESV